MLSLRLALAIAKGESWGGAFSTPNAGASVLYLQLEDPKIMLHKRIKKMCGGDNPTPEDRQTLKNLVVWSEHWLKLDSEAGLNVARHYLEKYRPDVLFIDPVYKILSGNMLDAQSVMLLLDNLDRLVNEFGVSMVLTSHTRKGLYDDWGSDDMLGSVFFSAWADSVIKVEREDNSNNVLIKFEVIRHAENVLQPVSLVMDSETLQFSPNGAIKEKVRD